MWHNLILPEIHLHCGRCIVHIASHNRNLTWKPEKSLKSIFSFGAFISGSYYIVSWITLVIGFGIVQMLKAMRTKMRFRVGRIFRMLFSCPFASKYTQIVLWRSLRRLLGDFNKSCPLWSCAASRWGYSLPALSQWFCQQFFAQRMLRSLFCDASIAANSGDGYFAFWCRSTRNGMYLFNNPMGLSAELVRWH